MAKRSGLGDVWYHLSPSFACRCEAEIARSPSTRLPRGWIGTAVMRSRSTKSGKRRAVGSTEDLSGSVPTVISFITSIACTGRYTSDGPRVPGSSGMGEAGWRCGRRLTNPRIDADERSAEDRSLKEELAIDAELMSRSWFDSARERLRSHPIPPSEEVLAPGESAERVARVKGVSFAPSP
ncbi:hypothetical protein H4582DRAFT_2031330 [Lactarius indigo]|nr:hypothetical protein H4582DRAFT_2031330 [Lactarius indigo]